MNDDADLVFPADDVTKATYFSSLLQQRSLLTPEVTLICHQLTLKLRYLPSRLVVNPTTVFF